MPNYYLIGTKIWHCKNVSKSVPNFGTANFTPNGYPIMAPPNPYSRHRVAAHQIRTKLAPNPKLSHQDSIPTLVVPFVSAFCASIKCHSLRWSNDTKSTFPLCSFDSLSQTRFLIAWSRLFAIQLWEISNRHQIGTLSPSRYQVGTYKFSHRIPYRGGPSYSLMQFIVQNFHEWLLLVLSLIFYRCRWRLTSGLVTV